MNKKTASLFLLMVLLTITACAPPTPVMLSDTDGTNGTDRDTERGTPSMTSPYQGTSDSFARDILGITGILVGGLIGAGGTIYGSSESARRSSGFFGLVLLWAGIWGAICAIVMLGLFYMGVIPDSLPAPMLTIATDDQPTSSTSHNQSTQVSVFDLEVGGCYDRPADSDPTSAADYIQRDCNEPHELEVYSLIDYEGGVNADYPGDDVLDSFAFDNCLTEFESYVETSFNNSPWYYSTVRPTQETWQDGDREIICFLREQNYEPITGSQRGSGE